MDNDEMWSEEAVLWGINSQLNAENKRVDAALKTTNKNLQAEIDRLRNEIARLRIQAEEDSNTFNTHHEEMLQAQDKLRQENKALRKDAERYQWLKDNMTMDLPTCGLQQITIGFSKLAGVDATIDKAMKDD